MSRKAFLPNIPSCLQEPIFDQVVCEACPSESGVRETLTKLRSRFWVVKGRMVVRQIVHLCTVCRRFEGRAYLLPNPPPLPDFQVTEAPPFTYTVDFAGPLYVKNGGEGKNKAWLCLYTCCVVRAVHLDLVPNMSTTMYFPPQFQAICSQEGAPSESTKLQNAA